MELKDFTLEKADVVAHNAFTSEAIKSDVSFIYKPYQSVDVSNNVYEEQPECVLIMFKGNTFGNTIDDIRLWIYGDLCVYMDILRKEPLDLIPIPVRNQWKIFDLFSTWNLFPSNTI